MNPAAREHNVPTDGVVDLRSAGGNEYTKLADDSEKVDKPALPRSAYNDQANLIEGALNYAIKKKGIPHDRAYLEIKEDYVDDEPNPELQSLGRLMLLSPRAMAADKQLDALRALPHLDSKLEKQRASLLRIVTQYLDLLTNLVEKQLNQASTLAERVTPDDVKGWLEQATGGDTEFAGQTTLGMQAELAAKQLLVAAGVTGVHRDPVADQGGSDLVFGHRYGPYSGVDVKTGRTRPVLPVTRDERRGQLFLSINPAHLNGFEVDSDYFDGYVEELRNALY